MDLKSTQSGDIQVVKVNEARIDAAVAIQFKDAMRAETEGGAKRVVLDLGEVAFVDSSGLGAIVAAMKQLGADQKLDLAGLTPSVDKVFRLTRMDTVFAIYPSLDAAMLTEAS
ncbi:STAS domain-containing protein [Primorskyibacter sp. S187A]|uniref:STAS domain-containing protein n=1 Tax=Primorskyibacter sp. S187A TaxID=3415130 RepID=UPI003C7D0732